MDKYGRLCTDRLWAFRIGHVEVVLGGVTAHIWDSISLQKLLCLLPLGLWMGLGGGAQIRRFSCGHIGVALIAAQGSRVHHSLVQDRRWLHAEHSVDRFLPLWPRVKITHFTVRLAEVALILMFLSTLLLDDFVLTVAFAESVNSIENAWLIMVTVIGCIGISWVSWLIRLEIVYLPLATEMTHLNTGKWPCLDRRGAELIQILIIFEPTVMHTWQVLLR